MIALEYESRAYIDDSPEPGQRWGYGIYDGKKRIGFGRFYLIDLINHTQDLLAIYEPV